MCGVGLVSKIRKIKQLVTEVEAFAAHDTLRQDTIREMFDELQADWGELSQQEKIIFWNTQDLFHALEVQHGQALSQAQTLNQNQRADRAYEEANTHGFAIENTVTEIQALSKEQQIRKIEQMNPEERQSLRVQLSSMKNTESVQKLMDLIPEAPESRVKQNSDQSLEQSTDRSIDTEKPDKPKGPRG